MSTAKPSRKPQLDNRVIFPDPRKTQAEGLLCVGGELHPQVLIEAYSNGIFPWPQEGYPMLWFSPLERGILEFSDLHISSRLMRDLRKADFKITFNQAFSEVIQACQSTVRRHEKGTWILPEMVTAYEALHKMGYVHSVEAWQGDQLVGGLYGVFIGGVMSGESMFFKASHASKACLLSLVLLLWESGVSWLDTQMVTPVVKDMGGKYVEREQFLEKIAVQQAQFQTLLSPAWYESIQGEAVSVKLGRLAKKMDGLSTRKGARSGNEE